MSEKNAPGHDSGSDTLSEIPEVSAVPAVPEVAGTPVRPELRLEVIAAPTGQFGASDAGDTTGYGENRGIVTLAPAAARPYGSWFDGVVDALIEAAESGKQVVAIVEIKARFDEENNIGWARKLERAGVHVVYGMVGLKTHCKLLLVVRQESDGLRRYCHVGTGNYHPKTARGYEDLGLLTCDRDVAQDLTTLFNQLSGYAPRARFRRLLVAPRGLRDGLVEHIEQEIANRKAGLPAWIRIKVNSIVDETVIDALYRASRAGVPVDIVVRGICGLRAGVEGLSENIRVRSILGRFLEHSRIYAFAGGGQTNLFIGSADLMHRNLDRRVEALVRITDPAMVEDLEWLVTHCASDDVASWHLQPDGSWERHLLDAEGNRLEDIQDSLMARARSRVKGRH